MSVADNYEPVVVSGTATEISFSWKAYNEDYLVLELEEIATGDRVTYALGADYTAVVDEDGGGIVTIITGSTASYQFILSLNIPLTQGTPYSTSRGFQGQVTENSFDKLTSINQQQQDDIERSLRYPVGVTGFSAELPSPVSGKALLWNTAADALENSTDDFDDIVTDATAQADAAAVSAAAALESENNAEDWATNTTGLVEATDYSSKMYAIGGAGGTLPPEGAAIQWAIRTAGEVTTGLFSAQGYATGATGLTTGSAKQWASQAEDSVITGGLFSALHYAAKALASAAASAASAAEAAASATVFDQQGYINGLIMSNAADTQHDITIATGVARNSVNTRSISLSSAITKQIDVAWSSGNNAGGFPSGATLSADSTYHVFVIYNPTSETTDAGYDDNLSATNLLADATGYTEFRHIGSVVTDVSSNIINFYTIDGNNYQWASQITDFTATPFLVTGGFVDLTLTVPTGIEVRPVVSINLLRNSAGSSTYSVLSKNVTSSNDILRSDNIAAPMHTMYDWLTTDTTGTIQHQLAGNNANSFNSHTTGYSLDRSAL